jgi:hypothetical protein
MSISNPSFGEILSKYMIIFENLIQIAINVNGQGLEYNSTRFE